MPDIRKRRSTLALAAPITAAVALGMLVGSILGYRTGWLELRPSLGLFQWAAYVAGLAVLLALVGLFAAGRRGRRRGLGPSLLALVLAAPVVGMALQWEHAVRTYPPINDITTDTEEPPGYRAAPEPAVYPGARTRALQARAYPDLAPLELPLPPDAAFDLALSAARDMGWEVLAADPRAGRIEAVATTPLFGFEDDVVIRLRHAEGETRLDVRSRSRVGRSDLGVNAKRIRRYLAAVRGAAD